MIAYRFSLLSYLYTDLADKVLGFLQRLLCGFRIKVGTISVHTHLAVLNAPINFLNYAIESGKKVFSNIMSKSVN